MRNTGILLFLAGIYIVINSGSLRDLVFKRAHISFLNPKSGEKESHSVDFSQAHSTQASYG